MLIAMSTPAPETDVQEAEPAPAALWETYEATAYTAKCRGCTGITKTGIDVRQTIVDAEGRRIIAVDPAVIPLGSTVKVRIGNETFDAVAADIGGAIKGRKVDVLMTNYDEAIAWGRRNVEVRVMDEGTR